MSIDVKVPPAARRAYGLPTGDLVALAAFDTEDQARVGIWFARATEERTGQRWPVTVLRSEMKRWSA